MMKKIFIITMTVVTTLFSCAENKKNKNESLEKDMHSIEKTSALKFGTYVGLLPCASCSGIKQKLILKPDNTFVLEKIYEGREEETQSTNQGTFKIIDKILILSLESGPSKYKIENGFVEQLDLNGNPIESELNYKLTLE